MCVIHKLLHSSLLFYPAAVFGNPSVDAGCVYASAAFAPARHTCQEKTPAGVGDREGPAGVTLRESTTLQSTRLTCCEISATELSPKKHHITNLVILTILKSTVFLIFCFLILSMCTKCYCIKSVLKQQSPQCTLYCIIQQIQHYYNITLFNPISR